MKREIKLKQLLIEALNAASMCWSQKPEGVFDSSECYRIHDKLIADLKSENVYFGELGASPGPYGMLHLGRGHFGEAIRAAKDGKKVARSGWNGQGMYAYIVPAASYPALTDIAKSEFGEMVPYRAYWALKTAQNDVATWAPSGSDSLAEDWMLVE